MLDFIDSWEDRIEDRSERLGEAIAGRLRAIIAAFVAFFSTLLVGDAALVEPIMSAPGAAWAFIVGLPGLAAGATASAGTGLATWAAGLATWAAGLLSSWGLGFVASALGFIAGQPIAGVGLLALVGVGASGWMDLGDESRFIIRAILVAVVGFVGAIVLGPGLIGGL